ncbi:MAG: hypothetical protein QT11_C0001G0596 [archaeon GW2011_AR20]|nr:MAG: hypothetical protein QT11_C0001G0596 [archaeon GW2011_AR20]MBS3160868.1 hypothetical protein [Candidatus Woesearchaeota archaeon]
MRIYPRVEIQDERAIPVVYLPDENYPERVSSFYQNKGREEIEEYVKFLEAYYEKDFRLFWDDHFGLKNIGLGINFGFDLEESSLCYIGHNIRSLDEAIPLFLVAVKYASLL